MTTSKWVISNGTVTMDVCSVCAQPYREGHIDCTCPSNHPARCDRPTYDELSKGDAEKLILKLFVECGGDVEKYGHDVYIMYGWIRQTIKMGVSV